MKGKSMFTDSALTTLNNYLTTIDRQAAQYQNRALIILNCTNAALAKIAAEGASSAATVTAATVTSTTGSSATT
jgi:hypothetical protein